jgi:Xaa-Pro aminopeptidase
VNYARRLGALQEEMERRRIDLVVYGPGPDHQYLTGLGPAWREGRDLAAAGDLLFVPRRGDPVLTRAVAHGSGATWIRDVRPLDGGGLDGLVAGALADTTPAAGSLGLGSELHGAVVAALARGRDGRSFVDAAGLLDRVRMVKEPEEIELLKRVAALTDEAMRAVIAGIRDGVTREELNLAIEMKGRGLGASHVSFPPHAGFVKSGFPSADPLAAYPPDKGLEPGTAIFFDVGFVLDGYCSDWGRSVYWGNPPRHAVEGYAALRQAMLETAGAMRAGRTRACDVYPMIEHVLDGLGYGDRLRARLSPSKVTGHQIGVEVHENPWLRPGNEEPLREGMVMCLEPKLWHPGEYYFRLEEMVLVGRDGAEFLTRFDRGLFRL